MSKKPRRGKRAPQPRWRWTSSRALMVVGAASLLALAGLAAFTLAGGDADAKPRRALRQDPVTTEAMSAKVRVVDNDFEPRDLTVPAGAEVTFEFKGSLAHDVTDEKGDFGSGIMGKGDSYVLTLPDAGTYYYYCTLHHAMQGKITVR